LLIVTSDSAVTLAVMRNRRLVTAMASLPRAVRGIRCHHRNVASASRSLLFHHSQDEALRAASATLGQVVTPGGHTGSTGVVTSS
jgi:hypothetical protein